MTGRVSDRGATAKVFAMGTALLITLLPGAQSLANSISEPGQDVRRDAVVQAVEKVLPSIVNISTESVVAVRDPIENLFQEFFGPYYRRRPPDAQKSLGSGVIIDEAGYILTNAHVVRRANRITVTLVDGREFEAKALSQTAKNDVALLKLISTKDEKFHAIRLAADDDLLLGETVLALGNPFGLGVSVSRGILSSKTRRPPVENEPLEMEDWLQTDAAINPGNSGGPLVNLRGEIIGLNVAVFREGQGIGFAIPAKRVSEAVAEIFTPEEVRNLWLGSRFKSGTNGVVTMSVEPGSPAEKAGLRVGDIVVRVNEHTPRTVIELNRELIAGDKRDIALEVQRKSGERRDLAVHLVPDKDVFNASLIKQRLGLTVQEVSSSVAGEMGLNPGEGLLIAAVERNSPAARANLARGHIIRSIDGRTAESVKQAAKMLYARRAGETVELSVIVSRVRGGVVEIYPARADVVLR